MFRRKVNGVWTDVQDIKYKSNGTWVTAQSVKQKVNGVWVNVYTSSKLLSSLPVGTVVSHTNNGIKYDFVIVASNHNGYPANSIQLVQNNQYVQTTITNNYQALALDTYYLSKYSTAFQTKLLTQSAPYRIKINQQQSVSGKIVSISHTEIGNTTYPIGTAIEWCVNNKLSYSWLRGRIGDDDGSDYGSIVAANNNVGTSGLPLSNINLRGIISLPNTTTVTSSNEIIL